MDNQAQQQLKNALKSLNIWKDSYGAWKQDSTLSVSDHKLEQVFTRLSERLKCNYPFHHPVYAGQMLKPPHPVSWAAYAMAMSINPNNHALDGGPPSSEMEKEVVAELANFFGYTDSFLGHLTASGTIANLEALWIARELHPNKKIAFSSNAHYTHQRMCGVLATKTVTVPMLEDGRFDLASLNADEIGTLVVTLGTTGLGDVEPLEQVLPWAKKQNIRIHIDAAYGGFYRTLKDSELINGKPWSLMHEADSIVVDPHKHGLQPYGCGCVLFKSAKVGTIYKHDSPYTYFSSDDLHLGEISLECSRAGAAAVALWATLQCFPLKQEEGFGPIMAKCRSTALKAYKLLQSSSQLTAFKKPELDIIGYFPSKAKSTSEISEISKQVFDIGMKNQSFYLSLFKIPAADFKRFHPEYTVNTEIVTILRSVFMKPEQFHTIEQLFGDIERAL